MLDLRVWDTRISTRAPAGPARREPEEKANQIREMLGFDPDAQQARVLESQSARGVLNCTRQWGKSTIIAAKAVRQALQEKDSLTLVVSPSSRQSGEFLRKATGMARRLGLPARGDGDNEISLAFPNGSRIVGLPGSEATVRGFSSVALLLVDEAARVTDGLYHAIRPMLAVSNGKLWLMSTPYGQRGFFFETWTHGGPEWERVRVTGYECQRIRAEFLREERRVMGERCFRQEYMCEFVETGGGVFNRELVERAFTEEVEPLFP